MCPLVGWKVIFMIGVLNISVKLGGGVDAGVMVSEDENELGGAKVTLTLP